MIKPYYQDELAEIYYGDCRDINTGVHFTGIVTDPPYELGFMGKAWDKQGISFQIETWKILREVCKSGAMMLSFGGTRTFHRIACAIEDAGWEIRDTVMWIYGSGFPKSLDISKAIDKQFGVHKPELVATKQGNTKHDRGVTYATDTHAGFRDISQPQSPEAQLWEGYGTALKPAYEPILVCMNPLDGTFANNALKHGVAGLNIDECRVPTEDNRDRPPRTSNSIYGNGNGTNLTSSETNIKGRFPANLIHDGSQMVMELFPECKTGSIKTGNPNSKGLFGGGETFIPNKLNSGDSGSAARFFYCAKASKTERNAGCDDLEPQQYSYDGRDKPIENPYQRNNSVATNNHPTVKPLALMEYLCKLIKPPKDALILDPFMGSGTTLIACKKLGIKCAGFEIDEHNCEIAAKRLQTKE